MDDMMMKIMRLNAKGFCCSQILLFLALETQGKTNPDLVRSMGGLCFGLNAGEICGAFSGGACLIALYSAKGDTAEEVNDKYLLMLSELTDWFHEVGEKEYGGTRCDDILDKYPDRSICGLIVADTYNKCMDILMEQGIDPAARRKR